MSEQIEPQAGEPPAPQNVTPFWQSVIDMYDQTEDRVFGPPTAAMLAFDPWGKAA